MKSSETINQARDSGCANAQRRTLNDQHRLEGIS
jgi:hypothetical protein